MSGPTQIVNEHWHGEVPEWIMELARRCEASSQRQVAEALKVSAAQVNQALRNKYRGDMEGLRDRVVGRFMKQTVHCPSLGNMPLNECRDWQKKAQKANTANLMNVRMGRACRTCPKRAGGGNV